MGPAHKKRKRAQLFALVLAACGCSWCTPASHAGEYRVSSCGGAPGGFNNAWTRESIPTTAEVIHENGCSGGESEFAGFRVREVLNATPSAPGDSGYWLFRAPNQTSIHAFEYTRYLRADVSPSWVVETRLDSMPPLESCRKVSGVVTCERGAAEGTSAVSFAGLSGDELRVGVRCSPDSPGASCSHGTSSSNALAVIFGSTVTISDTVSPTVTGLTGSLFGGGWIRGIRTAAVTGRDSTGLDRLLLRRDAGVVLATDTRTCDFTKPAPCASPGVDLTSNLATLDTASWPDGNHTVQGLVRDAGGNETIASATVLTDNTAPAAPASAGPSDGVLWSRLAERLVEWQVPPFQASPVVSANLTLCAAPGTCGSYAPATPGGGKVTFTVPGLYSGSVYLVDEAGNGTAANSREIRLGYDPNAGPAPFLTAPERSGEREFTVAVNTSNDAGPAPITSLAGEVCTNAATPNCAPFFQTVTDRVTVGVPGPGSWTLRVRAVDAATNASADATTQLRLDGPDPTPTPTATATRTPRPTPTASPSPEPGGRRKVMLSVTRAMLTRKKLVVRGTTSRQATGKLRLTLAVRRTRTKRTTVIRRGAFRAKLRLPREVRGALRGQLRVSYGGDRNFWPRTLAQTVQR